jgi:hypothetical protein
MKKLIIVSVFSFIMVAVNAQEVFQKGTNVVNLGLGLGFNIPVEVSYEYGLVSGLINGENGAIGLGVYLNWYPYHNTSGRGKWGHTDFVVGTSGTFHYQFVDKLDTYGGLIVGYEIAPAGSFLSAPFVGARYYFTPSFGAYTELGYNLSYLSIGAALKF